MSTELDANAKLAFLLFCEQAALLGASAPDDITAHGVIAARLYRDALRFETLEPATSVILALASGDTGNLWSF